MSLDDNRGSLIEAGTLEEPPTEPTEPVSDLNEPALESSASLEGASNSTEPAEPALGSSESGEINELLDSVDSLSAIAQGEVVPATVVKMTDTEVVIDVGLKCEGAIPRSEFLGLDGQVHVAAGDTVHVFIEHYNESEGTVRVSYEKAARRRAWEEVERAHQEQRTVVGKVIERIKGGLTVDLGIPAFLPGSHADVRPHFNLDSLVGQEVPLKVIKVNRKRSNAVVSRKLVQEEELAERRARLMEQLREGAVLTGRVKNLTNYGVFVDLGGIDGLLHITDLSWGRVGKPSEVVQAGQELRVRVLKYDPEKGRVSLGLKQLTPDPWDKVAPTYRVGERAKGRVVGVVDYGAFVELEPGIEGLIHSSEMSWSKRLKHPSKIVNVGDQVEVSILDVNPAQHRISLSLRQSLPDPWTTLTQKYAVGAVVEGKVRNLTEFGAFVEIEEGIDGLVHLSNMSWAKDVQHPSEILKKGQRVQVVILGIDTTKRRISLGIKQLEPDTWTTFCSRVQADDIVRGEVVRVASFGAFVEIEDGVEGLCHTSELESDSGGKGTGSVKIGKDYNFRILRVNPTDKKIGLSMKGVDQTPPPIASKNESPTAETQAGAATALETAAPSPEPPAAEPAADVAAPGPAAG
jgi:small subunit ribosomal protein S1